MSQEDFTDHKGIVRSTFGYWRKKYLQEKDTISSEQAFIPVKIKSGSDTSLQSTTEQIELHYPNGVRFVCSSGMDLSRLKCLIIL